MVKPLTFKGDKKPSKKRKRTDPTTADAADAADPSSSTALTTTSAADAAPADDAWVTADAPSDLAGPLLLVLPTTPPTALAADAAGAVFALPIENILDGDAATAEPHDVRMVWVARRATLAAPSAPAPASSASPAALAAGAAAATDGATVVVVGTGAAGAASDELALRAHHGRFLAVDAAGALSCSREAVGVEETFRVVAAGAGAGGMALMTARELFVGIDEVEGKGKRRGGGGGGDEAATTTARVRGDLDAVEFRSTLRVRMQARFKPRLRGAREERERAKVSWKELEAMVGRRLGEDEVRTLKRARRRGNFHEVLLDVKVKGKHDKFA
jgi:protein FRG1